MANGKKGGVFIVALSVEAAMLVQALVRGELEAVMDEENDPDAGPSEARGRYGRVVREAAQAFGARVQQ